MKTDLIRKWTALGGSCGHKPPFKSNVEHNETKTNAGE